VPEGQQQGGLDCALRWRQQGRQPRELDCALGQAPKVTSAANREPGLQAWPAPRTAVEVAWAKAASAHGRPVPFRFFAAKGEAQGGFPLGDAGPASRKAAGWGEK
jgi:hypothetical protein